MIIVSIWMTTYNHENYVAQAIEGVLMQKTDFKYELVIGEDFSNDNTRNIVIAYKNKYPDKIRLFLPAANLGMIQMTKATYNLCAGRYIAWLDGDDYWIDPLKLQRQVDFLESNSDCSFCFHKVIIRNQIDNNVHESQDPVYKYEDDTLSVEHFVQTSNPVYTLSVLHRNVLGPSLPEWLFDLPFTDWGLYFILCKHGKGKYMREPMGIYRIHKGGAYSGQSDLHNFSQMITFFKMIKELQGNEFSEKINDIIKYYQNKISELGKKNIRLYTNIKKIYRRFRFFS